MQFIVDYVAEIECKFNYTCSKVDVLRPDSLMRHRMYLSLLYITVLLYNVGLSRVRYKCPSVGATCLSVRPFGVSAVLWAKKGG